MLKKREYTIIQNILPGRKSVDNYQYAHLGRIWILYDDSINLTVVRADMQAVHCHVHLIGPNKEFYFSAIYDSNNGNERRDLWEDLAFFSVFFPELFLGCHGGLQCYSFYEGKI